MSAETRTGPVDLRAMLREANAEAERLKRELAMVTVFIHALEDLTGPKRRGRPPTEIRVHVGQGRYEERAL